MEDFLEEEIFTLYPESQVYTYKVKTQGSVHYKRFCYKTERREEDSLIQELPLKVLLDRPQRLDRAKFCRALKKQQFFYF